MLFVGSQKKHMKKDLARFVDKHGLDRELIEVKLSSPMTWALVSVKE